MDTTQIVETLSAHQGSWDSWGWHCTCGAREELSNLPVAEDVNPGKGQQARAGLLGHQATEIAKAG